MNMNSEELDPGLNCNWRTDFQHHPCVGRHLDKLLEIRLEMRTLAHIYCRVAGVHRTAFPKVSWWVEIPRAARTWLWGQSFQSEVSGNPPKNTMGEVRWLQHILGPGKSSCTCPLPALNSTSKKCKNKIPVLPLKAGGNINISNVSYVLNDLILLKEANVCWLTVSLDKNNSGFLFVDNWFYRTISEEQIWNSAAGCMVTALAQHCT